MLCSLSQDDKNYSVYVKLYEHLAAKLKAISESPDRVADIQTMMSDIYQQVLSKSGDHELSIRFARMLPTAVLNVTAKNSNLRKPLRTKGLDYNELADLADVTMDQDNGIEYTEKLLGTSRNLEQEISEIAEATPKKKRGRKKKEPNNMPEGQLPKDQLLLFDEEGNPILADVTNEQPANIEPEYEPGDYAKVQKLVIDTIDGVAQNTPENMQLLTNYPKLFEKLINEEKNRRAGIESTAPRPGNRFFEPVAPHTLKDTDNEALSMDKASNKYNVIDPAKKMYYAVKRAIIRMLNGNVGSQINYPGVGPVYLRAQSKDTIPEDKLFDTTTPVVLVVVDQFGNPVKFDEKGNVDPKGDVAFYNLRNPFNINGIYEQERIIAVANTMKVSIEQATKMVLKERAQVEKILKYISEDPAHTVGMEIDGGALGVLGNAPDYYLLSSVNFPTDAVRVELTSGGKYQFSLPSVSEQPITMKQMTFAERPELIDLLTEFMVEDVYFGSSLVSNKIKRETLEKYLMLSPMTISMINAGPRVMGEVLDTSTPEAKAIAKQKIKEAFSQLMPMGKPLSKSEVNKRVAGGNKIVTSVDQGTNGDILVSKDLETGEDVFRVIRQLTLNITEVGQNENTHFSLAPREDGGVSMNIIPKGYFNNYIKDNFMIDKMLNADNELVALNAYFTFTPLESETSKIDKYNEEKAQGEVDEFTKGLLMNAKKQQERFDALPESTKQAIEIFNDADATMPFTGVSFSLYVVQKFQNRLQKKLYTREQAEAILAALKSGEITEWVPISRSGQFNFTPAMETIVREKIDRYTRPTQPVLTGGATVVEIPVSQEVIQPVVNEQGNVNIFDGTNENAHLSNFAERPFSHPDLTNDETFNTVEGAFQAMKLFFTKEYQTEDGILNDEGIKLWDSLRNATGKEARSIGRKIKGLDTKAWDRESGEFMKALLRASFENNPTALASLQATGNLQLTHSQDKSKWGKLFPQLLMEVRNELKPTTEEAPTTISAVEMKDPLDTTEPPPSTIEKKRRDDSRKADASKNKLKKDNPSDGQLGGRAPEDTSEQWSTRVIQLSDGKITQEDIDTAKAWYEKHPLSKHFTFREAFDMVNQQDPSSIATWSRNGIVLYKGSNHTQLYHEAFHGFTQAFMTPAQREALYSEVRKMTGTFKDYEGKMVPFSYATDKQAEEYLAEQFRQYMLSQGKMAIKSAPARKSFFKKLLDILELLFGNLTVGEIVADSNANSKVKEVFDALRRGDMSDYNFQQPDVRFNDVFNSTGVQALNEDDTFSTLSKKDTKLLLDSIDGWIAQSMDSANSALTTEQELEDYLKLQVDMMMDRVSPEVMEQRKLDMAPKLTYSQSVNFLKTKAGRTIAYRRVEHLLSRIQLALDEEYRKLRSEGVDNNQLQAVREKLGLVMFARDNFGDLDNLENNIPDKDGVIRGVIALHMTKSKDFGTKAIELLDVEEEETYTRDGFAKDGAAISQKELAKAEVKYLFRTIFKMDPVTKAPVLNELGSPVLMNENDVWGKVALILENELDVINMYNKLVKYAQQDEPTEMSMAIAQLINKLGPRGLDVDAFPHLENRTVENLWTNFRNVFSMRRIALVAQNIEVVTDKAGNRKIMSTIGRGINPYAAVGKSWNSQFVWDRNNDFADFDEATGITSLNVQKLLAKYPNVNALKTNGEYDIDKVLDFLDAIGIKMSRTEEVKSALQFGSSELDTRGGFKIVETLLLRNKDRVLDDPINNDKSGSKYDPWKTKGYSLLEIIAKNGIIITKPQDIFEQTHNQIIGGFLETEANPLYISGLPGEGSNWRELQMIEGQYGSGLPSFMVTTADGNTKFEQSLNSSMSVMVTSVNSVEDTEESSAYEKLTQMPHMAKFDIDKNPNAQRYVWLTNMFNIVYTDGELRGQLIPKTDPEWGKRKTTIGGKLVKLELYDVSGARQIDKEGVSSAAADPYTKFVLDLHLAVQKGLPELMRHSDKSTSYSVILNYISSPNSAVTKDVTQGQYVPNYRFVESRDDFHATAFDHYLLPNLISEHNRVRRFMQKKKDIEATLKQIAKEKKAGQQITPTPVFDFNYLAQGQKFLTFEGLLNKKTKDALAKVEGDLGVYFADKADTKAQQLLADVIDQTKNYFEGQYNEVKDLFDQYGFVADNLLTSLSSEINTKTKAGRIDPVTSKSRLENILLNSWVYNSWIHNVESMNFLYGDIAQYNHMKEEFHKRNAGIASTGTGYRTDEDWLRYVNRRMGRKFEEQLTGEPMRIYDGTMNTGVMQDKITRSVFLEDIGYNLYKQMVDKAVAANRNATVKRPKAEIESEIKIKLFGKSHVGRDITSVESLKDIVPDKKSIMYNYYKMNEADAQGWISFDSYRILMDSQGEWTPAHENIYQALLRGEELPAEKIGTFFPPIKAQYWGALANDPTNLLMNDVNVEAFHKFQLTPIIPTLANISPKLKQLHEKMMREGIDYALFESGSKIGTLTSVQFDDAGMPLRVDEDGNVLKSTDAGYSNKLNIASVKDNVYTQDRNINDDLPFTKNVIHVEYLKNQLKIEPKYKGKSTFATQIRKLIEVDLMENGIPTDFLVNEQLEDRIEKWFALSPEEQFKASANFRDIIEYERAVYQLTQVKKAQLLRKAKLSVDKDGNLVGDLSNLVKYVKSQLTNQELADHEIDFINTDNEGKLKHDLSFSLAADKIEKLLNALVVKAIIRQKVKGESLIQVSGAMLEPQFRAPTLEELKQFGGTNGLTYYTVNPDGYVNAMKIKIAMQGDFEKLLYHPDVAIFKNAVDAQGNVQLRKGQPVQELDYNASLANLNRLIKDDNWLNQGNNRKMISLHGDRIPIQGLNSDEFAEVYEFLPKETGNIIILPAEIVAKSGGDFDIDKLTLMMPNIGMSTKWVNDKLEYNVDIYQRLSDQEIDERYEAYKKAYAKKVLTEGYESRLDKERALRLHFTLFGGEEAVYSSVIDLALDEGELLSKEEFALADQEKVAQNELLYAMNKLTSRIENYSNLVRPNGTDILDPIVDELKKSYRDYNPGISTNDEANPAKGIQASKIFEITYNLYKQMTNNLGKKALGIGAIDNTYNELFNRIGLYLTPNNKEINNGFESADMAPIIENAKEFYKQEKIRRDKYVNRKDTRTQEEKDAWYAARKQFSKEDENLFLNYERQTLFLPHNSIKVKGFVDKAISFAHRYDATGQNKIGDVISQLINGWVDIAKDPWIFYLRGNDKLGPMLLFLVQAGVPIRHAAYFVSQPIITEYMNTVDQLQSVYAEAMEDGSAKEEQITRDKAILAAKEIILEKLGIPVEGKTSNDRVKNLKEVIGREMVLTSPKDDMFKESDLISQLELVSNKYNKYDSKGRPVKENVNIDYSDPELADYQKAVFLHFLQVADMERATKDIKLRTNVDTGKSGTLYEAQDKIIKLLELKRSRQDDVKKSQTRYWRIPSDIIDRLIPTIKDSDGIDTGLLDESKITSPIASFYQQPFQLAIWKDLFTFRNNPTINKFLIDLSFSEKDGAKNKTYFTDDIELMSEFKSAMLPILFQNTFLTLDVSKLKDPSGPVYYRGSEVRLEKVEALPIWGAVYKDGVMYYDYTSLWQQFNSKSYINSSDSGVAPVSDSSTFSTFGEYVKFVFEREYLRGQFAQDTFTKMTDLRRSDEEFNTLWKASLKAINRNDYMAEGEEILRPDGRRQYERDRLKYAFEIYLRNKALKNVYNMHALFNGDTAYAYEIVKHKIDQSYGTALQNAFPILKNLVPDSESTKRVESERVNLAFLEAPKDKETINSYYEQIQSLSNEIALKKVMPTALEMGMSETEHKQLLYDIAETFRKLPIVAFLQSGMNTNGRFSLTRVVDNSVVEAILLSEVDNFLDKITAEADVSTLNRNATLTAMFNAFVAGNKRYDARGKNYMIPVGRDAKPTNLLEQKLFIDDVDNKKSYDPTFINTKGSIVKPYTRIGDDVSFDRVFPDWTTSYKGVVKGITWNKSEIDVDVEVTSAEGIVSVHTLSYSPNGDLVKYTAPLIEGERKTIIKNIDKLIKTKGTVTVTLDMLKELPEYTQEETSKVGDKIIYKIDFIDREGKNIVSAVEADIVELEEMGYSLRRTPDGVIEYASDIPRYRIKVQYETTYNKKTTVKTAESIIDATGKVVDVIDKQGYPTGMESDNMFYVNLRDDRVKGQYIVETLAEASQLVERGIIAPGTIVDVVQAKDKSYFRTSNLIYLDASTMTWKRLEEVYTGEERKSQGFNIDATNYFIVFNEAEQPGASIAATRASAVPLAKGTGVGNIDLRDRFVYHSDFQNKMGVISRKKYGGGSVVEFFTDDIDSAGKPTVNAEVKKMIDESIERVKKMRDENGLTPVFSKAGYGQYMIGSDDTTGKMFTDKSGNKIGQAVAPETFKYLSTRLLEEFGYINPNFVKEAEGIKEIVKVVNQPITDEQYSDLMNKCFA